MEAQTVSQDLTRLVLGLDQFYRQEQAASEDHLDQEGLIPVHWSALAPEAVPDWPAARRGLLRCAEAASALHDPWARDWLCEYALSVLNLGRWLFERDLDYESVVAGAIRVPPRPLPERVLRACRSRRDLALQAAGYSSYAAFLDAQQLSAADVPAVMEALTAEAEARTRARLPLVELPAERIGVRAVSGTAFTAYCDYPGRQIWINTDVAHTRAGLKHLVAHEAYPGHYAHMGHRDALVERGAMTPDGAIVMTNTGSSVLFEGIAEAGLDLLAWRDDAEDAVAWEHNRLQWLCSVEVAHGLNTGRLSATEAAAFLRETCDGEDAWIDAKLRFVTHPLRAPFVYTYWWGGTVVRNWWRRVAAAQIDAAVHHLFDFMHSPSTLSAHWPKEDDR